MEVGDVLIILQELESSKDKIGIVFLAESLEKAMIM